MNNSDLCLPHLPDIERVVLGAVLVMQSRELFEKLAASLSSSDFFLPSTRSVFEALLELHGRGAALNHLLLREELRRVCKLEKAGGAAFVASLTDGIPYRSDLSSEIALLKEASAKRDLIKLGDELVKEALAGQLSTAQITRKTEHQLNKLRERIELADESKVLSRLSGLYLSLDDLLDAEIPQSDEIMLGVRRGQPAMLAAITNKGKTTMLANICLMLCAGKSWHPLIPDEITKPRKVVFLDFESTSSELRDDLRVMLNQLSHQAKGNFIPIVEPMFDGEPLNLSKKAHFDHLCAVLRVLKPDLLIIDTISVAFTLFDENNNAEVARVIARPLKQMAKSVGCAIIYTHHIGKQNENASKVDSKEESYLPRGASAFAGFTRTIYTLKEDKTKGEGYIVLRLAKAKGAKMEPTLYRLNFQSRWFERVGTKESVIKQGVPTVEEVVNFIRQKTHATTKEVYQAFEDRSGERSLDERLKDAEMMGLIEKASPKAPWYLVNPQSATDNTAAETIIADCGNNPETISAIAEPAVSDGNGNHNKNSKIDISAIRNTNIETADCGNEMSTDEDTKLLLPPHSEFTRRKVVRL